MNRPPLDAVTTVAGASVDTPFIETPLATGSAGRADGDEPDDAELDDAVPNAERLVAQAVALAGDDLDLATLVDRYWRFAPDEELVGCTPQEMLAAAREHRELARQRVSGELKLRIRDAHVGAAVERTTIEIVVDDMPFLVDSVTGALSARNLGVHLLVHPILVVHREPLGRLVEVCADVEPDDALATDQLESWMRVETDPVRDPAERDELRNDLQRVLTDVREAVEDWPRMRERARRLADELLAEKPPVPEKDITDSVELLHWLADDHFTFLGYREYELVGGPGGEMVLRARLGSGLGILRQDQVAPRVISSLAPEAYGKVLEKRLLIITKANSRATVHRSHYLDYIGFKTFDEAGNVTGEKRFLGLLSSSAYRTSVRELPVVRRKVAEVLDRSGLSPRSHSGKDLLEILETYPRDELFQIKTEDLYHAVVGVLRMAGRRQLRLFLRRDGYGRFISCLIFLPRDRFTTGNRLRMQEILLRELNGVGVDYTTRVTESMLARVHFIVRTDPKNPPAAVDPDGLAELLADATRFWDDDFRLVLERKLGDAAEKQLFDRYAHALPEAYKNEHTPMDAVKDLAKLELLEEPGQLEMHLFRRRRPDGTVDESDVRFKVFRYGEPMILSAVLPVLHSLGVLVNDERPYEIGRADGTIYLYDFGLGLPEGARAIAEVRAKVANAFSATWRGEAEVDGFNELVLRAGLTWRQVVVLRAYAKYLRQAGTVFSQKYIETTFIAYPRLAELLVRLFEHRFSPAERWSAEERAARVKAVVERIDGELDAVTSLDQDRILRSFLKLIQATLRTSFFQRTPDGRPKSYVAFKLDPQAIPDLLPAPRPRFEVFVYSPRFEGVHLRFGRVARGGLRWSDRREDFRTEVLGLVKAQTVKNAVIVPVGAKGGFVLKQPPSPGDREALQAEGVACYKRFISALLDVTDNIVGGRIVPPPDVVRHDDDDPYLVVAADKGTATFSDTANAISVAHGFWLGDAFASGGSAGYDHKKMGITARGAWESVKRHFRELASGSDGLSVGVDTQAQDFTMVGIGDMSGDVFGNGALLSEHIRLVAAFDHRHIFLDPSPEAAPAHAERRRLFELPRSSWDDYNRELISEGGGVYPRTAKSIPITPQVRAALGLANDVTRLAPPELIRAILLAPVDLLFNGGIGTYVKASTESHADVGDKSNDAIRVNGRQLRCKVVGEGGNLGMTQRGRIEYALGGGRIGTDFIDNSAGVDCSDREVNIKILLADPPLPDGERNELLAAMTDEVAALVLRDNYAQATALGNAREQSGLLLPVHRRMLTDFEKAGQLDRSLEALPTDEELAARPAGLTSPEFAVLLAYVKIVLEGEVLVSGLPDEEWTHEVLREYFPTPLRERFADRMPGHRLHREIVTTVLVNEVVNRGGTSFVYRAMEETGATAADVLRAYVIVREVYGLRALWAAVEALDNRVPSAAQTAVYLEARRLMDRAVRWLISNRRSPLDVPGEIERLRGPLEGLLPRMEDLFLERDRAALRQHVEALVQRRVPAELATWSARLIYGFGLLDVLETAAGTGTDPARVAEVYYVLSERFRVDDLLSKISALPREDRWQTLARMALRYDLYAALAALTGEVLRSTAEDSAQDRVSQWEQVNAASIAQARVAIGEVDDSGADLAALSVLLRQVRTLVRTAAA
ncbi:NAD-glutamate dehydrogenase [Rhizomonospora bruguierae]|uniref:NAD-glutamate dehydrogenase n=1 Tax=Rhizomonospora bruguierae TaxID=1581705 RepID=UPI001BCF194C|nr:NAD-glutamate dehydrogenase [Micromonospora sp. NBRC 107566]